MSKKSIGILFGIGIISQMACAELENSSSLNRIDSNRYTVGNSLTFNSLLEKRLLAAVGRHLRMTQLFGTEETIWGLYSNRKTTSEQYNNRYYDFVARDNIIPFAVGEVILDEENSASAKLIEMTTNRQVGSVYYKDRNNYPFGSAVVEELCTGNYESVCRLSFDWTAERFQLDFF